MSNEKRHFSAGVFGKLDRREAVKEQKGTYGGRFLGKPG